MERVDSGEFTLALVSISLGIENGMGSDEVPFVNHHKGIRSDGNVTIGDVDLTHQQWYITPYLAGEYAGVQHGSANIVPWSDDWQSYVNQPLIWYRTTFPAILLPSQGLYSVLIDMTGMGRGHMYINGHDLGRYWLIEGGNTGLPTQRLYHLPQDWLSNNGNDNTFVILEELGSSNVSTVEIVISQMKSGDDDEVEKKHEVNRIINAKKVVME